MKALDANAGQPIDAKSSLDERIRRAVPTLGLSAGFVLSDRQTITGSVSWANRGGLVTTLVHWN